MAVSQHEDTQFSTPLQDPVIAELAETHGVTPAQVILRWHFQSGRSAIPKSTSATRIGQNFDVFGFELSKNELDRIDALDTGGRGGPESEDITLDSDTRQIPEP